MDNSKTGKPGELDYAVAIGFSPEEGKEAMRFLHLAKNKMKNGYPKTCACPPVMC